MKTFCKLTTQSPAASYVPLPRFLLQDEALRGISNDAKVLYALLLDRSSISRQNGYVESRTAQFGCTSPWSRRKPSSTAAARAPRGSYGSWNTAA